MLGAIALVGIVAFWYLGPDLCGNVVIAQYPSPSGEQKLVVFQRSCGATTGFTTQASLLRVDEAFSNRSGNVFSADTDHGLAPAVPGGGPELLASWQNSRTLRLSYDPRTRVFKAESSVARIDIQYQQLGPNQ